MSWRKWLLVLVLFVLSGAAVRYFLIHRDDPPSVAQVDVDPAGVAARTDWVRGEVRVRPARPEEFEFRLPDGPVEPFLVMSGSKAPISPGTYFEVSAGAALQMSTNGNFIVAIDGPGSFVFENARRDSDSGRRTLTLRLKHGTLRAKRHDQDSAEHWLELYTPRGRLILQQGEIGIEVNQEGLGRFWIVSGTVVFRGADGTRRENLQKGVYPL